MSDLYEAAIREWIIRRLRGRGHRHRPDHTPYTSDHVRNVKFGIEHGFHGSDITPPDEATVALSYDLRQYNRKVGHWTDDEGWVEVDETIEYVSPAEFVQECLAIYHELAAVLSDDG